MTTFSQALTWFLESFHAYDPVFTAPPRLINRNGIIQLVSSSSLRPNDRVLWRFTTQDSILGIISTHWDEITFTILLELLEHQPCKLKEPRPIQHQPSQSDVSPSSSSTPCLKASHYFGTMPSQLCLPTPVSVSPNCADSSLPTSGCSMVQSTPLTSVPL